MVYHYALYWNCGVIAPILFAGLLLAGAVVLSLVLFKRRKHAFVIVTPGIVLLCVYMLLIALMYSALPFLENLFYDKEADPLCDLVYIEEIENASLLPIYYSKEQKMLASAGVIKTNRGEFYCINSDNLTVNAYYEVKFLPQSRVILYCNEVTEIEAQHYWKKYPNPPNVVRVETKNESGYEGVLIALFAYPLAIKSLLFGVFYNSISNWLCKREHRKDHTIRPRLFGILDKVSNMLLFALVFSLACCTKSVSLAVILGMIVLGYGYYTAEIFSTHVTYIANDVLLRSFTSSISLTKEEIISLRWEYRSKSQVKALVIYTRGKKTIRLQETDFLGLYTFYQWWLEDK